MDLGQKKRRKRVIPQLAQRVRHKRAQEQAMMDQAYSQEHPTLSPMRTIRLNRGRISNPDKSGKK